MKKDLKVPNVRLQFDHIITTMDTVKITASGIVLTNKEEGEVKSRQTVLVAGPNSGVIPGDEIELWVERFPKKQRQPDKYEKNGIGSSKFEIALPIEVIDKEPYLFISTREIKWIYVDPNKAMVAESPAYASLLRGENTNLTADKPC